MQMAISVNNLVSILPTLPMIVFNVILYKKLKALLTSDESFQSDVDLQNCVFRAKITVLIGWIYVCSQVLTWIFSIIHMVSFLHTLDSTSTEMPYSQIDLTPYFGIQDSGKSFRFGWSYDCLFLPQTYRKNPQSHQLFCELLCLPVLTCQRKDRT